MAQYEQRSEETSSGHIANEKWLTAWGSAILRERQRLYLQCMPYCPSLRKTAVCRDFLRHCVTSQLYKSVCTTYQTCLYAQAAAACWGRGSRRERVVAGR